MADMRETRAYPRLGRFAVPGEAPQRCERLKERHCRPHRIPCMLRPLGVPFVFEVRGRCKRPAWVALGRVYLLGVTPKRRPTVCHVVLPTDSWVRPYDPQPRSATSVPYTGAPVLPSCIGRRTMALLRPIVSLVALGAVVCSGTLNAQNTNMDSDPRHGGFGGPVVKFSDVDSRFGVFIGGRGGGIINESFTVGGGGYALANSGRFDHLSDDAGEPGVLEVAYGGLELGYVYRPRERIHGALVVLLGAGGVSWDPEGPAGTRVEDGFFVLEPELAVVLNVTESFRAALGLSYRLTQGVELLDVSSGDLSGPAAIASFAFGRF